MISGNKGEWSEVYTLFKLLGDGVVYSGDKDLKRNDSLFFPIISVIRMEEKKIKYDTVEKEKIVVVYEEDKEVLRVSTRDFIKQSQNLLKHIQAAKGSSFALPDIEEFMSRIRCKKLKASSVDKTDIKLIVHDLRTGTQPTLGFSIKSQLGGRSTLLNPGKTTNFTYKLTGKKAITNEIINNINAIETEKERLKEINRKGYRLEYVSMDSSTFEHNLIMIDSFMPNIVALTLSNHYILGINDIGQLVSLTSKQNPIGYTKDPESIYKTKFKNLLVCIALGMTPGKAWDGQYEANGGYLIVKKDGDIVCYHFYDRNQIEDYLINNTDLDNPSRNRYKYGSIYRGENGDAYIKLCLQIRFK